MRGHLLLYSLSRQCDGNMGALPAGFFKGAGYFFTFYVICISSMIQMSAVYRLLAAASPNMDIASATGEWPPRSAMQCVSRPLFCNDFAVGEHPSVNR